MNDEDAQGIKYTFNTEKSFYIVGTDTRDVNNNAGTNQKFSSIVIPNKFNEKPVVIIGKHAFRYNTKLEVIFISSNIREILYDAFAYTPLKSITFESNSQLTRLDRGIFYDCQALTSIYLPFSLKSIGYICFARTKFNSFYINSNPTTSCPFGTSECGSSDTFIQYPTYFYVNKHIQIDSFGDFPNELTKIDIFIPKELTCKAKSIIITTTYIYIFIIITIK